MTSGVIDKVIIDRDERITSLVESERISSRNLDDIDSPVVDAWALVPALAAIQTEYSIPESIMHGLYIDISNLRADLTAETGNRELATINTKQYVTDNFTSQQTFTDLQAIAITNPNLEASVLAIDLSNYSTGLGVDYLGNPLTFASLQDIYDRGVAVDNAQATFTDEVDAYATTVDSYVQQTTTLSASIDDLSADITEVMKVTAGTFTFWDTLPLDATNIGEVKYTTNSLYPSGDANSVDTASLDGVPNTLWQYLGTGWEPANNGWREIENIEGTLAVNKSITTDVNGNITGWTYSDGSGTEDGTFKVLANKFTVGDGASESVPVFTVEGDQAVFQGKVTFTSGGTSTSGTINEAITANIEQVTVGDKNINITDNLIPTTSLLSDINNAGYQFIGDPIKASAAGIETFSEPQIVLDANDEVYSPYVDELTAAYYYRFGIYGVTALDSFGVHTIDAVDAVTETNLVYNMLDGNTIAAGTWYIVDGIINPSGGDATSYSGSIRTADGTKIGEVQNIAMPADAEQLALGWQYDATVSRPKLAKITADTLTGAFATTEYVSNATSEFPTYAQLLDPNQSLIDGGTIVAGSSVNAPVINSAVLNSGEVNGSLINGAEINGGTITGAIIKASFIDSSTTKNLTNWAVVTDINTIPVQYWDNFAQDALGNPIADVNGKYRIYTSDPVYAQYFTSTYNYSILSGQTTSIGASPEVFSDDVYTYDYYQVSGKKLITVGSIIDTGNVDVVLMNTTAAGYLHDWSGISTTTQYTILGYKIKLYCFAKWYSPRTRIVDVYVDDVLHGSYGNIGGNGNLNINFTIDFGGLPINFNGWINNSNPGGFNITTKIPASVAPYFVTLNPGFTGDLFSYQFLNAYMFSNNDGNYSMSNKFYIPFLELNAYTPPPI